MSSNIQYGKVELNSGKGISLPYSIGSTYSIAKFNLIVETEWISSYLCVNVKMVIVIKPNFEW